MDHDCDNNNAAAPGLVQRMIVTAARRVAAGCGLLLGAASALSAPGDLYPTQPAAGSQMVCVSESGLSCFNSETMDVEWRALRGNYTYKPVITSSAVLVGSSTGLHVRHAGDGSPHWNWNSGRETASPVVSADTVYAAGHSGRIAAMALADGDVTWSRRLDGRLYTPAVLGGQVITGRRAGVVQALSMATGETLWRHTLPHELVARPVAVGSMLIMTTFEGSILALSPSGEVLWKKQDPAPSFHPAGSEGLVIFGGLDGTLRARDPATGNLLWRTELSGQLSIRARLRGDRVAVATPDRELAILNAGDGEVLARTALPGAPLGGPMPLASGEWRVFFRDAGEISWVDASLK